MKTVSAAQASCLVPAAERNNVCSHVLTSALYCVVACLYNDSTSFSYSHSGQKKMPRGSNTKQHYWEIVCLDTHAKFSIFVRRRLQCKTGYRLTGKLILIHFKSAGNVYKFDPGDWSANVNCRTYARNFIRCTDSFWVYLQSPSFSPVFNGVITINSTVNLSGNGLWLKLTPNESVWNSWIVVVLTSQDTWSHVSVSTVQILEVQSGPLVGSWCILTDCSGQPPLAHPYDDYMTTEEHSNGTKEVIMLDCLL